MQMFKLCIHFVMKLNGGVQENFEDKFGNDVDRVKT